MTVCSIDGCTMKNFSRRMCQKHYFRWRRHGDPKATVKRGDRLGATTEEKLTNYVVDDRGCMRWTRSHIYSGYGMVVADGKNRLVHRVAYETWVRPIPDGFEIDHLCYVRDCINPEHLEAVPQAENKRRANARRRRALMDADELRATRPDTGEKP